MRARACTFSYASEFGSMPVALDIASTISAGDMTLYSMPRLRAIKAAMSFVSLLLKGIGIFIAHTRSGPKTSTKCAVTTAESIPPLNPVNIFTLGGTIDNVAQVIAA